MEIKNRDYKTALPSKVNFEKELKLLVKEERVIKLSPDFYKLSDKEIAINEALNQQS